VDIEERMNPFYELNDIYPEPEPTHLILVKGAKSDEMLAWFRQEAARLPKYGGAPIIPPGWDTTIIDLRPTRIEPDIEDES